MTNAASSGWSLPQVLAAWALVFLALGLLDGLWLGWLAKDLYRREMGELMAQSPRLVPAALFYLAYPVAIVHFGLRAWPHDGTSLAAVFLQCAALGLVAYGTYDLTNLSVIRGFSTRLAAIDMAWGTFASGVAGASAAVVLRWWAQRG